MNKAVIRFTIGTILKIEALLFIIPILTALYYGESEGFAYLYTAIICLVIGFLLSFKKPINSVFYLKEGCVATVLSWIVLSLFGGLPFFITGEMNGSFIDSMFESVSGFTTTGATILSDVEVLSRCTLIWRSLTHWIGGMGVLVFLLALLPLSGGSNINLLKAESSSPSKIVPKLRETARILYTIYIILTLLQILLLVLGKTPFFDSVNIAFSTTGTGGFGIKNASLGAYSPYVQWVTIIFMVMSGMRFDFYYFLILRGAKKAFSSEEVRAYLLIFFVATAIIFANILSSMGSGADAIRESALATSSIMSTTGFGSADFNNWPALSQTVLIILVMIGGCSGSTAGGLKVSRLIILIKSFRKEIVSYIHPRSVKKVRMDGAILENEVLRATNAYLVVYFVIMIISFLLVSISGNDIVTNFTSVSSSLNNVGPGLAMVGPAGNFGFHTVLSKIVLIFDMIAGRLELFPLIILFKK